MRTAAVLVFLALAAEARADAFYPAIRVQCDAKAGSVMLVNAGAYNEKGIRKTDARRGIYVPSRDAPKTEIRCDSPKTRFLVSIKPVLDRHDKGDTARVSVTRNGKVVLEDTLMDDDRSGLQESAYVMSVAIAATGEPRIEHSCKAQIPMALKCGAGSPARASRPGK